MKFTSRIMPQNLTTIFIMYIVDDRFMIAVNRVQPMFVLPNVGFHLQWQWQCLLPRSITCCIYVTKSAMVIFKKKKE